jgi:hypothetical protein
MGGRSGGGGGLGSGSRSGIARGVTERGYSKQLAKEILDVEGHIKNRGVEHGFIFDDNGNILYSAVGNDHSVALDIKKSYNAIITHNHPIDGRQKGTPRADGGGSFSDADLKGVVASNAKEVRAVTGRITYSMKRPAGGWGKSPTAVIRKYHQIEKQYYAEARKYYANYKGDKKAAWRRVQSIAGHVVSKKVAKEFGWDYTWKHNK